MVTRQVFETRDHSQTRVLKLTSEGTKWVASPAATNSLPFSLAPVKAKYSPANVPTWF